MAHTYKEEDENSKKRIIHGDVAKLVFAASLFGV